MNGEQPSDETTRPARRVDRACDRFEAAWKAGRDPRVEDYLAEARQEDRPALLGELVALERELRRRGGDRASVREYRERYPGQEDRIDAAFRGSSTRGGGEDPGDPGGLTSGSEEDPPRDRRRAAPVADGADAGPEVGDWIGPYHLLEHLGAGGMGHVYRASHRWLKRIVALKVLREEIAKDDDAVRRFRREVEAVGRLSHPNIVLALDADVADGRCFLAMEYVVGRDLSRFVRERGPLPVAAACDCIRQAALGLAHVHEHALVHRDIKPANLLMAGGSVIKVADLGLARLRESGRLTRTLTQDGSLLGTPDYLAPEQAAAPHLADIRADIYSLGCTFYYLLVGHPPFPGGSYLEKVVWHQEREPEPIERHRADVPPRVARILRRMTAKRPEDRYQGPAEIVEALDATGRGPGPSRERRGSPGPVAPEVVPGREEPASAPPGRGPLASRWRFGAWAAGLSGALVGGLLLVGNPRPAPTHPDPATPREPEGERRPPPGAVPDEPAVPGPGRDATDDVRQMIEREQYYKLSGPAGPRYFVVGKDVTLDRATRDGDALAITLKVGASPRGIGLLNLEGLAELEFRSRMGSPRVVQITEAYQEVTFDRPGTLVVRIRDIRRLRYPSP
jgi:hypothetical protein